jgi:hypothetical protein
MIQFHFNCSFDVQENDGLTGLTGLTGLMQASKQGHPGTAKALIKKGADVNEPDSHGDTPLMLAARDGHTATAEVLLESGADIDVQNTCGYTALMLAALKPSTRIVKALLEKGAVVNLQNHFRKTALDVFIENRWKKIIIIALINQDFLETYRDPRSKYGKEPLIGETLKLIDEKKEGLEKKSLFVRLFSENISRKISSYLRMIDLIKLSQVSKESKPIFFSSQETGKALRPLSHLPLYEGKREKNKEKTLKSSS